MAHGDVWKYDLDSSDERGEKEEDNPKEMEKKSRKKMSARTSAQPAGSHGVRTLADVPRADAHPALAPRSRPPVRLRPVSLRWRAAVIAGAADASQSAYARAWSARQPRRTLHRVARRGACE